MKLYRWDWRWIPLPPPICHSRQTDGRGRCPGASGPPQSGGPAHQPGQLAPGAVRPFGLAGAGRGPAPPVPMAPPGAPSRCPAGPLALAGLSRCARARPPPLPGSGLGPLIVRAPSSAGAGAAAPPSGAGAVVGSRPRPLPWPVGACARPSRGRRGSPPPRPLRRLGAAAGRALPLRRCALGGSPQPRPLRAALGRPCCPPGGPAWGGPPCGCCGLPLAGDPSGLRAPLLRAGGPLARCAGLLGRSAAPRLALPRRCAVGHSAPPLAAARQLRAGRWKARELTWLPLVRADGRKIQANPLDKTPILVIE